MNDETILFQDNQPNDDHKILTLKESYKNFEYILFGYFDSNNYLGVKHFPVEVMKEYTDLILGGIVGDGHNASQVTAAINVVGDIEIQQRNKTYSYTKIVFIKGINRII